eukprot:349634-Chlamydomonas_euryale.AAC.10
MCAAACHAPVSGLCAASPTVGFGAAVALQPRPAQLRGRSLGREHPPMLPVAMPSALVIVPATEPTNASPNAEMPRSATGYACSGWYRATGIAKGRGTRCTPAAPLSQLAACAMLKIANTQRPSCKHDKVSPETCGCSSDGMVCGTQERRVGRVEVHAGSLHQAATECGQQSAVGLVVPVFIGFIRFLPHEYASVVPASLLDAQPRHTLV